MVLKAIDAIFLGICAIPLAYYLVVLYSAWRFFRGGAEGAHIFTPPVSCLKPIRGLDAGAYENFASFCRQDYPDYEILFCVDAEDPARSVLEQLARDFPEREIRLLIGAGREAVNDKVARLERLTAEAQHDLFVISDGDVRVGPDYLRSVVKPFRDPKVGAATCLYASIGDSTFLENLQSISMASDFFAGILAAWKIDGVKFALGQTIVTTRPTLAAFGGYRVLEDRPADDLYIGRLTAEQGLEVKLLPYVVGTSPDFQSLGEFLKKRMRWMRVMRLMRPWGHLGLIFTWGLPWAIAAVAARPSPRIAAIYLGAYVALRAAMAWMIGAWGMKQKGVGKRIPLIPLWDAMAFAIWLTSFAGRTIHWRGRDYRLREGKLYAGTARPGSPPSRGEAAEA